MPSPLRNRAAPPAPDFNVQVRKGGPRGVPRKDKMIAPPDPANLGPANIEIGWAGGASVSTTTIRLPSPRPTSSAGWCKVLSIYRLRCCLGSFAPGRRPQEASVGRILCSIFSFGGGGAPGPGPLHPSTLLTKEHKGFQKGSRWRRVFRFPFQEDFGRAWGGQGSSPLRRQRSLGCRVCTRPRLRLAGKKKGRVEERFTAPRDPSFSIPRKLWPGLQVQVQKSSAAMLLPEPV